MTHHWWVTMHTERINLKPDRPLYQGRKSVISCLEERRLHRKFDNYWRENILGDWLERIWKVYLRSLRSGSVAMNATTVYGRYIDFASIILDRIITTWKQRSHLVLYWQTMRLWESIWVPPTPRDNEFYCKAIVCWNIFVCRHMQRHRWNSKTSAEQ